MPESHPRSDDMDLDQADKRQRLSESSAASAGNLPSSPDACSNATAPDTLTTSGLDGGSQAPPGSVSTTPPLEASAETVRPAKGALERQFDHSAPGLFEDLACETFKKFRKAMSSKLTQESLLAQLKDAKAKGTLPPVASFPSFHKAAFVAPGLPDFCRGDAVIAKTLEIGLEKTIAHALDYHIQAYERACVLVTKFSTVATAFDAFQAEAQIEAAKLVAEWGLSRSDVETMRLSTGGVLHRSMEDQRGIFVANAIRKRNEDAKRAQAVDKAKHSIGNDLSKTTEQTLRKIIVEENSKAKRSTPVVSKGPKKHSAPITPKTAPKAKTGKPGATPHGKAKHFGGKKDKVQSSPQTFRVGNPATYPASFFCLPLAEQVSFVARKSTLLWMDTRILNNNIHVLTQKDISEEVKRALSLNYKFIPTPARIPTSTALSQWEDFERRIRFRHQYNGQSNPDFQIKFWIPKPNATPSLMPSQHEAILSAAKTAFVNLINQAAKAPVPRPNLGPRTRKALSGAFADPDIMILPTDKNLGLTVIDTTWYLEQGRETLQDAKTYSLCDYNPEQALEEYHNILHSLKGRDELTPQEWKWLWAPTLATATKIPTLKLLPKIHKSPASTRPIIPTFETLLSNASIWVDHQLQSHLARFPWILKDSKTFCRELLALNLDSSKDYWLVTGDVVSMYPSIPTNIGVQRIAHLLKVNSPKTRGKTNLRAINTKRDLTLALLTLILKRNFVQFENQTYLQIAGTAMGTALAPAYANLFMASFEKDLLPGLEKAVFYRRYIDDMFTIIEGAEEDVLHFQETMKSLHPSLRFTWEASRSSLPFLDVDVKLQPASFAHGQLGGRIATAPFQKRLNAYLYIPWTSYHPAHVKLAFVKGELIRYVRLCSDHNSFLTIAKLFYTRLRARGYPPRWLSKAFLEIDWHTLRAKSLVEKAPSQSAAPLVFKITYNPLWDQMNFGQIWTYLKEHMEQVGFLKQTDEIILSRSKASSLGDLVNASNKKTLAIQRSPTESFS